MLYEKLDYVLAVAEEQNLTRAAQKLFVSQPTLTVHLNHLEEELGVKLFDRTASPITVTPAGQFYIEQMRQVAAKEKRIRCSLQGIPYPAQTFVIGIGQVRGRHLLPMILPDFCTMHPDVQIQLVQMPEQNICAALKQSQMDLVIGVLPNLWPEIEEVNLLRERLVLAAGKCFGLVPEGISSTSDVPCLISAEALNKLPFIVPGIGNGLYTSYETLLRLNRIQPGRTISVNDLNTGLQFTRKGLGVQLLSVSVLALNPDIMPEELDFFRVEHMPEDRRCVAAFRADSGKRELIADFLDILRREALPKCVGVTPL